MNTSPFKRVAGFMAADGSRRGVVRTAAAGAAAAALAAVGMVADDDRTAHAKKKCKKKECKPLDLGAPCTSNKQCCPETNRICSTPCTGDPGITPTVCCGSKGASCTSSSQCCSTFVCNFVTNKCQEGVC